VHDPDFMSSESDGSGDRPAVILEQTHVTTAVGGTTVDGKLAEPFLEKASTALLAGDWAAAEDAFAEGIAFSPLDARLHGGLALIAIHQGDWNRAVSHGRQAAALPGAGVEVHNNLGWALEQRDDLDQAARAYQSAFQLDPTRPEPIHHLSRLGLVPRLADDPDDGEPVGLETLQRLELYQHLAAHLQREPPGNLWRGTYLWAAQRGAPWGRLAAWLLSQRVTCDREVLQRLARRDEHLGESIVTGMLLGDHDALVKTLGAVEGVALLGPDDPLPEGTHDASVEPFLVVRIDEGTDRARVPPQRTHAGIVFGMLTELLDQFGPTASAALIVDPAAHLGPRRVWLLSPLTEAEVVGTWTVEEDDGSPVEDIPVPDGSAVRSDSVLLSLPGIDVASLQAVIDDHGLGEHVRPAASGEGVVFDADRVGALSEGWSAFLDKVAGWIPEGHTSFVVWRERGVEHLAILERGSARRLRLVPSWPVEQDDLDLPVAAEVQLLGRALFQAPRSGLHLGARASE
jgi:Flp pilus assembly protein TadD